MAATIVPRHMVGRPMASMLIFELLMKSHDNTTRNRTRDRSVRPVPFTALAITVDR